MRAVTGETPILKVVLTAEVDRRRVSRLMLLEAIERTGSISAAGRALGISYRSSWAIVEALNEVAGQPVTVGRTGGGGGGGSKLTPAGRALVTEYHEMESYVRDVNERLQSRLQALSKSDF